MTKKEQRQKKEGLREIQDIAWEKIKKILPHYESKKKRVESTSLCKFIKRREIISPQWC